VDTIEEEGKWGDYARGAVYALRKKGYNIQQVTKLTELNSTICMHLHHSINYASLILGYNRRA
jgi:galactokinase